MWVVIVVGMYRCSAYLSDFEEDTADKAEESGPEENKEDTKPIKPNSKDPVHDALALDGQVRVLIMNQGYQSIYHTELVIACSEEMTIDQDGKISMVPSGSEYVLTGKILRESDESALLEKIKAGCNSKISAETVPRNIGENWSVFLPQRGLW